MRKRSKYTLKERLEIWESDYGRFKDWVLEKNGLPIAKLKFTQNPEAYWDLYETTITTDDSILREEMVTADFWKNTHYGELVWRNDYFDCCTVSVTAVLDRVESYEKIVLQLRHLAVEDIRPPRLYEKALLWMRMAFKVNKYSKVKVSKWRRNTYKISERLEIWESDYGRSKGWIVEKGGLPIANLRYIQPAEMFWDCYEATLTTDDASLRERMLTAEFWEQDTYEDLGWRNVHFDFYTQIAMPVLHKVESSDRIVLHIRYLYIYGIGSPRLHEKALLWWRKLFKETGASNSPPSS